MELSVFSHEYYMKQALKEAHKAYELDEVPVGAVIVLENQVIARAHNLTEQLNDVTAHAEMQAFTSAAYYLGAKYLTECTLYVTIEPCPMCAAAAYWTQIDGIIYGASDEKNGFTRISNKLIHPSTEIKKGVLKEECSELMRSFFRKKR